ncbi:MAG: HTH-type transcriptional activator RhaR [Verrucomicrobiae bacterium]|nr:HTH-type transcriptional activator RhaR [Verrucomicrobiae bacterium]
MVSPPRSPAALAAHRARCLALADRHGELSRYHRREAYRYEPSAFQHALAFIEAHLTDRLTLEQVTRHAGLSPGPFSGQLKKTTGYRFSRYVATRRIERAKDLLLDFNKKVSTVADEAGFQSWPDFYFWFKRLTRLTPTEYRRRAARRKWPRQKKPGQNGAGRNGSGKKKRARNSGASCRSGKPR